jgi:indolepyruvate ferredoxin oxidoreductase alpha subunit
MAHSYASEQIAELEGKHCDTLYGDGALVVLKALLESGISYIGGYPGSPVANVMDAAADAYETVLKKYGIFFETSSNEMAAAALLTTSVYGPVRGAVTWKVLGNGVGQDVVDHVSQIGVQDGAMIVVGEDYGGSSTSVLQRTLAWGVKSGIIVIDSRGDSQVLHRMVKEGMDISRDSQSVVAVLVRPQLSHCNARVTVGDNVMAKINTNDKAVDFKRNPATFPFPPNSYNQESARFESRLPTAARLVVERKLNEYFGHEGAKVGIITHGTTFNTTMRLLSLLGLADEYGDMDSRLQLLQLNVIHPLNDDQIANFIKDKSHVLLVEEGQPELLEMQMRTLMQKRGITTRFYGHDIIPKYGELLPDRVAQPLARFIAEAMPELALSPTATLGEVLARKSQAVSLFPAPVPPRIPTFCTGCPERPIFANMKIEEYKTGQKEWHGGDVGCYGMAAYAPFGMADSNMGMGGGLAAAAGISALSKQQNVSVVGDGTLWHSAFNTSAANAIYNRQDAIYIVADNKWTAMTGAHENPNVGKLMTGEDVGSDMSIEKTFRGMGVKDVERVNPYDFKAFNEIMTRYRRDTKIPKVRVLISEAECQLQKQRRVKPEREKAIKAGERVEIDRLGVDAEVCVGDHACIRFNGCPSLTLKEGPNSLRTAPIAAIDTTCVGCGVCGEVTTAAQLCPSFFKGTKIENANWLEKIKASVSRLIVGRPAVRTPVTSKEAA